MSFAEFVSENQMILISLVAVAGPMSLALILFTINKVRGLASTMSNVGRSDEDELMNLAAVANNPGEISLAPIDPEDDDEDSAEAEAEDDDEDEDEEPQPEEEGSTPSDIQAILNDVFVDDEAMERYQVLVGESAPVDVQALAQFADEVSHSLGASA